MNIHIAIHRQTVSSYQNSSAWLDTYDAWSRDRNPSKFTLDLVSDRSANKCTTLTKGFIRYYVATAVAASVCLQFYTQSATRVLNSFEELCIMWAAAENSFARVLNPHGGAYIVIHRQFFRRALHTYIYVCVCVATRPHEQDAIQGQFFLSKV